MAELALPRTGGESLPSRLSMSHVQAIEAVTDRLRALARQYGGQAEVFGAAAKHYTRWMKVPATEAVKVRLGCALAELHTEAGWCYYDSGVDGTGHFTRALALADEAKDAFGIANAAWHAGATLVRNGHPHDALKAFQLGQCTLEGFQPGKPTPATVQADDPRVPSLTARLGVSSAAAYALLDHPQEADRTLVTVRENWQPRDVYERADKDLNAARIQLDLGRLDLAEPFAATAARTFGDANRRDGAGALVVLAELHVRTGEPRGLQSELLVGLAQQGVVELVEWIVDGRDLQTEAIGEAAQCGADRQLLLADTAELGKPLGGQAGERGDTAGRGAVEDLHRFPKSSVDLLTTGGEILPDGLGEKILLRHAQRSRAVRQQGMGRLIDLDRGSLRSHQDLLGI